MLKRGNGKMNQLIDDIKKLKEASQAVILAHYYVNDEVQEIADYIGDSYYLAKVAKNTDAKVIVFCGVSFMGESAKILNPDKKVLMPDMTADCPMAHMVAIEKIEKMRQEYEDLAVVCYINSTAKIKSYSDVCVTSSNAVRIVKALPNKNIFFVPDENLGRFVAAQVPEKNVILNDGFCHVHTTITPESVKKAKEKHPGAKVLAHPECKKELLDLADYIGSTADIIDYAGKCEETEFIICTEEGVGYKLRENNPDKKFYFGGEPCCKDMKYNTVESILSVLQNEDKEITVDEGIGLNAIVPLERMLELAK